MGDSPRPQTKATGIIRYMLKALLLDLDNTLVLFDEPAFYQGYFRRIAPFFADLIPPETFLKRLVKATRSLKISDGRQTNVQRFMTALTKEDKAGINTQMRRHAIWQRFIQFYEEEYDRIEVVPDTPDGLHVTLEFLAGLDLNLVLASNPIFPEMLYFKRLAWAGIAPEFPFHLITHIENMSYVKPHTGYYLEICRLIDLSPAQCLMVGNDAVNDMAAGKAGMHTYLTTDADVVDFTSLQMTVERADADTIPPPAYQGPFKGVPRIVRRLSED